MKTKILRTLTPFVLALILLFGLFPTAVFAEDSESTSPWTVTVGDKYTDYTYRFTAGVNGNSAGWNDRTEAITNDKEDAYHIAGKGKAVIYTIPLEIAERGVVKSFQLTIDAEKGRGVEISSDKTTWLSVLDDCYSNARNESISVEMPNAADFSADTLYIKFDFNGCIGADGKEINKWHDGYLYGFVLTVRYYNTVTEDSAEDGTLKTVKTEDYTKYVYSLTAGTKGNGSAYCVSIGSDSKKAEDNYCGGKGTKGVIYKLPLSLTENIERVVLTSTVQNRYCIDVSVDGATWLPIVGDGSNTSAGGANSSSKTAVVNDVTEQIKTQMKTVAADGLFVRYYVSDDWNAPKVYGLNAEIRYTVFKAKALDVSLDGDIGLKFGVLLTDTVLGSADYQVEFVKAGETKAVQTVQLGSADTYETNGGYQFFRLSLAPAQMTEKYSVKLVNTKNGDVFVDGNAYSVAEYAVKMMEYDPSTTNILKAMLNYGAYAQIYFGINTECLANDGYAYTTELGCVTVPTETYTHSKGESVYAVKYNVELETKVKINVLFSDDTVLTKEVSAKELNDAVTLTNGDCSFTVGFMTYAGEALSNENAPEALANLLRAMILYSNAADAYFGA